MTIKNLVIGVGLLAGSLLLHPALVAVCLLALKVAR